MKKPSVLKEIEEVGSITVVANKHNISPKTVHNWFKASRSGDGMKNYKEIKSLHQQIKDISKCCGRRDHEAAVS